MRSPSRSHMAISAITTIVCSARSRWPRERNVFSRIRGTVIERTDDGVVLDVGGLSYAILLPACVAEKVAAHDDRELALEIYSVMNMEGNTGHFTFYGFSNAVERDFFEKLLSVA